MGWPDPLRLSVDGALVTLNQNVRFVSEPCCVRYYVIETVMTTFVGHIFIPRQRLAPQARGRRLVSMPLCPVDARLRRRPCLREQVLRRLQLLLFPSRYYVT